MTKQEILAMGTCTTNENFIYNGDTFVIACREAGKFCFEEYGVCSDFSPSTEAENYIIMRYFSLTNFPPFPKNFEFQVGELFKGIALRGKKLYEFKKFNETFSIKTEALDQFENMYPFRRKYQI